MENAKQIILEAYGLKNFTDQDKRRSTIDAKKIYIKYCRDEQQRTYHDIGSEMQRTHCAIMNLYKGADWVVNHESKAKRVWHLLTNGRRCNETLEKMAELMEGIEDQEVYKYVLEQLPAIINAKKKYNL